MSPTDRNNPTDIIRNKQELIYENLTHKLIGCFFHVHNAIGVGFDEKTYHNALKWHFHKTEIKYCSKPRKSIVHRGEIIREFEADFIVYDKIILELKTLKSKFIQPNYVQIISELKLWGLNLGLLVNFGLQKVEIERIPFTDKKTVTVENYDYIEDFISEKNKHVLHELRAALFYIIKQHGLGYGESVYNKILKQELSYRQIHYQSRFPLKVIYSGELVSVFKLKPLLIDNQILCLVMALSNSIDFYDIAKIQSYLRHLSLRIGLIVNFGKNVLEIRGVRA